MAPLIDPLEGLASTIGSVPLGTLPAWLMVIALIVAAIVVWRGGGGQAIDILQKANHVLRDELSSVRVLLNDATAKVATQRARIVELEKERSLEPIIEAVTALFAKHEQTVTELIARQEQRAQDRQDAQLKLLSLIADKFGTEPS